ncbi:uncharacterized protein At4g22758-like [Macadamia integrifolia]|uniref:uncharacterized protein At4g22758-like n=1 Tax=Macadamia integrifolia TaxID=60698 RepID=UPI001C4FEFB6|nr:uncharacterized protein At4g22758-like [Macadamia integrifolia]
MVVFRSMKTEELSQMHWLEILRKINDPFETSVAGESNSSGNHDRKLTKLLVNVTIEQSVGPVHLLLSPENTVEDLIKAALNVYVKEQRRPLLTHSDPQCFELHYSQFSLECLNRKEKLIDLGSRNFYLCSKRTNHVNSPCSDEAKKTAANKSPFPFPWTRLMDFLL